VEPILSYLPSRPRHVRNALFAVPAAALLLSGCGGPETTDTDPDSGEAADDTITIYSGRDEELVQDLLDRLGEETGLEVEVRYGDTAELAAAILEEGPDSPADVYFGQDAGALGALAEAGMLAELPEDILERVPETYRSPEGDWVGLSGRSRVIAYDTREVDDPPDSIFELTEPEWEGEVAISPPNGSFQAFVTGVRVLEGDEVTREWLEGLMDNDVQYYDNNNAMYDAIEAGEVQLALSNHYYWYQRVQEEGEDALNSAVHYLPGGDPGALVNIAGAGVLASSENSEGAEAAVEFLLGEEAQEYFTQETTEYPVVEGVETMDELPDFDALDQPDIDLGDLRELDETLQMLEEVGVL
jgi:iron(III) transport system substrate-binding protein